MTPRPDLEVWLSRFHEADRLYRRGEIGFKQFERMLRDIKPIPRDVPLPASMFCPGCERNVLVTATGRLWRHRRGTLRTDPPCRLSMVSLMALCCCTGEECRLAECMLCPQLLADTRCPEEGR